MRRCTMTDDMLYISAICKAKIPDTYQLFFLVLPPPTLPPLPLLTLSIYFLSVATHHVLKLRKT
jgi:hypothetical protein